MDFFFQVGIIYMIVYVLSSGSPFSYEISADVTHRLARNKGCKPPLTEIVNIGLLSVGLQFNNLILRIWNMHDVIAEFCYIPWADWSMIRQSCTHTHCTQIHDESYDKLCNNLTVIVTIWRHNKGKTHCRGLTLV